VFPDWDYLRPMLAVAVGTHVVAFVLRVARTPLWLALPVLMLVVFVLLGLVYYRDTLSFLLPSGRTIELMRIDLRLVLEQFSSAVAPVPSEGSFATATAATVAVCAVLADTFAFRAFGRVEAIVPTGVLFIFTSALGTDTHRVVMAALWIGTALGTVAVLRFDQHEQDATWMGSRKLTLLTALPAILVTIGLGAVAASAVAPRLPGAGEEALIDTRNRQSSVTEVLNPLVDIRARMKNRGNSELFTMQSSDGPHYWRAISLPKFDGNSWSQAQNEGIRAMGNRTGEVLAGGAPVTQVLTVKGARGNLIPAAYHPVQVAPDDVFWAAGTQTLVLPDTDLQKGDQVLITSLVPELSPDRLRAATSNGPPTDFDYLFLPSGLPDTARNAALQVTENAATPFDRALALQSYFQDNFTYDLNVQLGNSNDAIDAFLRDRRGFCQQFAGTFAVMARSIGLPARVAVGFTPGDFGTDGVYHVYGRHAHAWPEVWFDGIGWVAFEPTPGRGSPDGDYTGVGAAQDDTRGVGGSATNPGDVTSVPDRDPTDPGVPTTGLGQGRIVDPDSTTTLVAPSIAGGGGSGGSTMALLLFGAVVALALWVLLAPRVIALFIRRRHRDPRDRVVTAWYRACHSLTMAGAPPVAGATPLEYADTAEVATGVDHRTLRELAVQVTRAVYAPAGVDYFVATRCETLEAEVDAMCRTRTPMMMRARSMVDPRLIRRRLAG
jgi:transglutaminase-like putative cysteine protease